MSALHRPRAAILALALATATGSVAFAPTALHAAPKADGRHPV